MTVQTDGAAAALNGLTILGLLAPYTTSRLAPEAFDLPRLCLLSGQGGLNNLRPQLFCMERHHPVSFDKVHLAGISCCSSSHSRAGYSQQTACLVACPVEMTYIIVSHSTQFQLLLKTSLSNAWRQLPIRLELELEKPVLYLELQDEKDPKESAEVGP
jgi:hypothetical protein